MSELSVGSLSGLAANSYVVDIASGSSLDLANAKADSLPTSAISTGGILQVVSTTKTDAFSESVGARPTIGGAITGLTATITPRSTSSKILVVVTAAIASNSSNDGVYLHLFRDGAVTGFQGDAAGSRQRAARLHVFNYITQVVAPITYLDSPSTTSSVTYDLRLSHDQSSTATVYCNRGEQDVDDNLNSRAASSITLIEVAG